MLARCIFLYFKLHINSLRQPSTPPPKKKKNRSWHDMLHRKDSWAIFLECQNSYSIVYISSFNFIKGLVYDVEFTAHSPLHLMFRILLFVCSFLWLLRHRGKFWTSAVRNISYFCNMAELVLFQGDVIVSFDDVHVGSEGTVPFRSNERIAFRYLISQK